MIDRRVPRRAALASMLGLGLGAVGMGAAGCGASGSAGGAAAEPGASTPSASASGAPGTSSASGRVMGAEWESHVRTFMAWPASADIWGSDLPAVQNDVAALARAIAGYEHVVLLARPDQQDAAQSACGSGVEVVPIPVDDLWARDTAPVFIHNGGQLAGVDFNFNGWGDKQPHADDANVAKAILQKYGVPRIDAPLVAEGGALETDGQGTLMATESSLVNSNRNPGKTRQQIEDELKQTLGLSTVIWFAGVAGQDITDAHVDCLARFVAPGVVLLDKTFPGSPPDVWSQASDQARTVLADATDARGRKIQVIDLPEPDPDQITGQGDAFVSSYTNFFIADGAVFLPKFGDAAADDAAQQILRDHFPDRDVVAVAIDAIAAGGGGIHCATHDMPGTPS